MTLVTMKSLLDRAYEEKYTIPAFNFFNTNIIRAVIETAEEENSPVILAIHEMFPGPEDLFDWWCKIARSAVESANTPIALHLDHGGSFDIAVKAIVNGCSSVMIDRSALPMAENIAVSKKVVDVAHPVGRTVEAELGHMTTAEKGESGALDDSVFTVPEEASTFVKETGVDALAVAVGTVHGLYAGKAKIDFERLDKINRLLNIPLVLHGGTGIPDDSLKRASQFGVSKVNVGTALMVSYAKGMEGKIKGGNPRSLFGAAEAGRQAAKETIRQKIRLLGSDNKL